MTDTPRSPDIVFVHGAWVGPRCWDTMAAHYEKEGLTSIAPTWPEDERPYEALRAEPSPALARVGVQEIADHYERIIRALPRPPLLVGHSFGGLIVQILLSRGLGSAGVAIHSAPPRGILPTPGAVWASLGVLTSWLGWRRVLRISRAAFVHGFVHQLPEAEQQRAYDEQVIPTPGRPFFQAAFAPFIRATAVDFGKRDRPPLLLTSGATDRTVPAGLNRANHRAYARSGAVTDLLELPGRSHWVIAEPGWEELADRSLAWAQKHGAIRTR